MNFVFDPLSARINESMLLQPTPLWHIDVSCVAFIIHIRRNWEEHIYIVSTLTTQLCQKSSYLQRNCALLLSCESDNHLEST